MSEQTAEQAWCTCTRLLARGTDGKWRHVGMVFDCPKPEPRPEAAPCEYCGPICYRGAAHNARVEDGARFESQPQQDAPIPEDAVSDALLERFAQFDGKRHPWPYVRKMANELRASRAALTQAREALEKYDKEMERAGCRDEGHYAAEKAIDAVRAALEAIDGHGR